MSFLSRRRNALLFVHLAERNAHVVLASLLPRHVFEHSDLNAANRSMLLGALVLSGMVMSVLGGIVADRWLGYRRSVLGGAALMVLGYGLLSLDGRETIVAGLVTLVLGQGLSHNSVPVLLGELRAPEDPRRDTDFLLFGFLPVLASVTAIATTSSSGSSYWSASMLIAGAIVGAGALVMAWAYPAEPPRADLPPEGPKAQGKKARVTLLVVLFVAIRVFVTALPALLGVFVQEHLLRVEDGFSLTTYVVFYLLGFLPLILLGVFAVLRAREKRHLVRDKLGLGMLLATASFAVLLLGALLGGDAEQSSMPWILLCHLISSLGMWLLGSMTLSLAARHLPPRWKATLLGLFVSDDSTPGVLGGGRMVFAMWPSVPGLGLVAALSLGAALLWRSQGRRLVEASRGRAGKKRPGERVKKEARPGPGEPL